MCVVLLRRVNKINSYLRTVHFLFNNHCFLQPFMMSIHVSPLPNLRIYDRLIYAFNTSILINSLLSLKPPLGGPLCPLNQLLSMPLKHHQIRILQDGRLTVPFIEREPWIHRILLLFKLHSTLLVDFMHMPECRVSFENLLSSQSFRFIIILHATLRAIFKLGGV